MDAPLIPDIGDTRLVPNKVGRFEIRWTEREPGKAPRSRTHSTGLNDRRQAERYRMDWHTRASEILAGVSAPTIGQMLNGYKIAYMDVRKSGATQYGVVARLDRFFGHLPVDQLSPADVGRYTAHRRAGENGRAGVADPTLRRELNVLIAAYGWANRTPGFLPLNMRLPHIELPADGQPRQGRLTDKEERVVFELAAGHEFGSTSPQLGREGKMVYGRHSRVGRFTCLALATAARASAIEKLTWDRVEIGRGVIDFRGDEARSKNKRKGLVAIASRLKPVLVRAYDERLVDNPARAYVLDSPGSTSRQWVRFRADVLGHPTLTRHDLRRTYTSLAIEHGVDMVAVAEVTGDDPRTLRKHYAHFAPDFQRAAVDFRG